MKDRVARDKTQADRRTVSKMGGYLDPCYPRGILVGKICLFSRGAKKPDSFVKTSGLLAVCGHGP